MIVTYHGESCLKIQYGDFILAYNPPKKTTDGKVPRFGANLVLVSTQAHYVFWLAMAAHVQLFSIMAGYIAQLVKRRISAGKDGISFLPKK